MAHLVFSVICKRLVIEDGTGVMSLLDIVSAVNITPNTPEDALNPTVKLDFNLVAFWARSDVEVEEELEGQLMLQGPSGKASKGLVPVAFPIDLKNGGNARVRVRLEAIKFDEGAGRYMFLVRERSKSGRWLVRNRIPVDVNIAQLVATRGLWIMGG